MHSCRLFVFCLLIVLFIFFFAPSPEFSSNSFCLVVGRGGRGMGGGMGEGMGEGMGGGRMRGA